MCSAFSRDGAKVKASFVLLKIAPSIGNHKDDICLQLHGQVSKQQKRCRSAMLEPEVREFFCASGSLYSLLKSFIFDKRKWRPRQRI